MNTNVYFTVGKRLGLGFLFVIILLITVSVISMYKVRRIDSTLRQITQVNNRTIQDLNKIRRSVQEINIHLRDVMMIQDQAQVESLVDDIAILRLYYVNAYHSAEKLISSNPKLSSEERALFTDLGSLVINEPSLTERI